MKKKTVSKRACPDCGSEFRMDAGDRIVCMNCWHPFYFKSFGAWWKYYFVPGTVHIKLPEEKGK